MAIIRAETFEDQLVLYFRTDGHRINAYTLATSLVSMADAIKRANDSINPGFEVEVVVEALGPGSFKAVIKTVFNEVKNLFSADSLRTIVLAVIASFIYEHALKPDPDVEITINTTEVVIDQGEHQLVVPRSIYDEKERVTESTKFREPVSRLFKALQEDEQVLGLGLSPTDSEEPDYVLPPAVFERLVTVPVSEDEVRTVREVADLEIVRAILERSSRKWQFVWRGVRISAPITDESFFDRFNSRAITIAPGDSLRCELLVVQERDPASGVYENRSYEIVKVLDHHSKAQTAALDDQ